MKKIDLIGAALAMSLAAFATSAASTSPKSVSIATGEYEPMVSAAAENGGAVSHLVTTVFEAAGYEVDYAYMPWKRALETTRRGDHTATSYWYESDEREGDFHQLGPLFEERLLFFRMASEEPLEWSTLSDLAGLRIGVVDGYTYTPELWALGESGALTLERAPTDEANLRKLLAGRIDLFPVSEATGLHLVNTLFDADERARFEILEKPLSVSVAMLLISRSAPNADVVARDFAEALVRLRAEGAAPEVIDAIAGD